MPPTDSPLEPSSKPEHVTSRTSLERSSSQSMTGGRPGPMAADVRMPFSPIFRPPHLQSHTRQLLPFPPLQTHHSFTPYRSQTYANTASHYPAHGSKPECASATHLDPFRRLPEWPIDPHNGHSPSSSPSPCSPSLVGSATSTQSYDLPRKRKRSDEQASAQHENAHCDSRRLFGSPKTGPSAAHAIQLPPLYTTGLSSPHSIKSTPTSTEVSSHRYAQVSLSPHAQPHDPSHPHTQPAIPTGTSEVRTFLNKNPPPTRYRLHIRQQPRCARAGPDGKDRRTIDPPPVLQLQIQDFDSNSKTDMADLKSSFWVVYCKLVSASSPRQDMSVLNTLPSEDGQSTTQRQLLGTSVSSGFFCADDPDPDTAPEPPPRPPSPSARLMMHRKQTYRPSTACTFFIFADVSVRRAGEYRLEFTLMRVDAAHLVDHAIMPGLDHVTTDPFRVVNAKDFDQVQPSTPLVRGLIERGAGWPLKLKKGPRDSRTRRGSGRGSLVGGGSGVGEDDDDDEEG